MSHAQERVVVTRGDRFDVAEWSPGEPTWFGAAAAPYRPSRAPAIFALAASILAIVGTVLLLRAEAPALRRPLVPTVADIGAVHAGVTAAGVPVRRTQRLAAGDAVETDATGRARVRLDDGTAVVVDRSTRLSVREARHRAGSRPDLRPGRGRERRPHRDRPRRGDRRSRAAPTSAWSARPGARRSTWRTRRSPCAAEEGVETTVRAGDTATVSGGKVTVAPERGYDDWTGGLAAPWAANGAPRRAVGELWGRPNGSDAGAGAPLTIRSHDVRAVVTREVAETEIRTTFFNAGSTPVFGDYRMALPPGAIVSRFATVRGESVAEGHVALAARNQSAAIPSSELLEWAGEGWVRGGVPVIAPGETVSVVVGYVEGLSPRPRGDGKNLVVEYRYPMVGDGAPPLVGEFSARVDAGPSMPISVAAGLGARVAGAAVEVRRPDFRPTADLVVDIEIEPWENRPPGDTPVALRYSTPRRPRGDDDAGGTVLDSAPRFLPISQGPARRGVTRWRWSSTPRRASSPRCSTPSARSWRPCCSASARAIARP